MSNSMLINCVSKIMPPARSMFADAQLVYDQRGSDSIVCNIIYKIINFTNRFMQCGQSTVVSLMGSIQHCILFYEKLAGFLIHMRASKTFSDGIISVRRNARNIHEYLNKIKKSGQNLQCFNQWYMIEAVMYDNYNNFNNYPRRKIPLREEEQTIQSQLRIMPLHLSTLLRNFL